MTNNEFENKVVEEQVIDIVDEGTQFTSKTTKDKGPWKVFAVIGYVFGIVSLASIFIPFFSCGLAVEGIILSALGKKSTTKNDKAKKGLTFSIIACVINFILSIIVYVLYIFALMNAFN